MVALTKAGRYEIVGELGRGAMGVVYRATDPVIGRTVAVKTIRLSTEGTGLSRPELLTRFRTEARAAGLLTHPNIVVVFDAGEEDGLYFITMVLVEGKSLQTMLDAKQPFPLPRVLNIMEQICSALQFAHEHSVVHRDIKPANLMLSPRDTVKITDFGTAKIMQFGTVQQTSLVMGTPSYMSPEQVKGRPVDGRSDIFSLGVVLYEMMTGEKPFPGENITTVIYKIVNEEPVPPRKIDPQIHPGICHVIAKALAKEPEQRYQHCREMLDDLKNYAAFTDAAGSAQAALLASSPAALPSAAAPVANDRPQLKTVSLLPRPSGVAPESSDAVSPVRRTGTLFVPEQPKKSNVLATVLAAIFLLAVIVYGAQKLRPVFRDMAQIRQGPQRPDEVAVSPISEVTLPVQPAIVQGTTVEPVLSPSTATPEKQESEAPIAAKLETPLETKSAAGDKANSPQDKSLPAAISEQATPSPTPPSIPAKTFLDAPSISPSLRMERPIHGTATLYKRRIERMIAQEGWSDRVTVQNAGNNLTLAGNLRPFEHGALLKFLRDAPAGVYIVDHIGYDSARAFSRSFNSRNR